MAANESIESGGEGAPGPSRPAEQVAADPWEFMMIVDVISKLPSDFYEQLESKKWSERKAPLDKLAEDLQDVRLEPKGQYGEIVSVLKKIISKDSNILVVAAAGSCLTGLALGLRKKFSSYAPMVTPIVLEKFKEKKPVVVKSMIAAIDAVIKTTTLEALLEDIVGALGNKSPSIKIQTALFLSRVMTTAKKDQVPKKVLKPLTAALIKIINDSDAEVREAAAAALGASMKMAGEKAFLPFISEIAEDHLKMEKIKEFYTKAMEEAGSEVVSSMVQSVHKTLDSDAGGGGGGAKTTGGARPPGRRTAGVSKPAAPGGGNGGKAPLKVQKAAAKSRAASAAGSSAKPRPPPISEGPKVPEEPEISAEEAAERAEELFPADARSELESAIWKERISGIEKILTVVKCMPVPEVPTQVILMQLNRKKENNFQALNQKLDAYLFLAKNCPFTTRCFSLIMPELLDKIADSKHGAACKQILSFSAEALSFKHVSEKVMESVMNLKNPKCQSETLLWLSGAINEFGLDVNVKQCIDVDQKALSANNPAVRSAGVELAGILYLHVGARLRSFFEGEKAALLQNLDSEFQKYEGQKPQAPSRRWKLEQSATNSGGGDKAGEGEGEEEEEDDDRMDVADLLPRKDISEQITDDLLEEMCNPAWKTRLSALERVQGIVADAKYVTPNLGGLPEGLRARLGESNKNLAQLALTICEQLAKAVGPKIRDHVRTIAPGIIYLLGDGKPMVRQNAANCLNAWVEQCGLKEFLEGEILPTAFKKTNPVLTAELLKWLVEKLSESRKKIPTADLKSSIPALLAGLEDRNPDVRKQSQEAILPFMKAVGYESMHRYCADLKPPSSTTVQGVLDKARAQLAASSPPSASVKQQPVVDSDMDSEPASSRSASAAGTPKGKPGARGRSTSRKPGEMTKSKKEDDSFEGGALIDTQQKLQRFQEEKSLKIIKWHFSSPTEELIEQLKNQLSSVCKPALLIQLFHADFKQHLKAIEALFLSLELCPEAVLGASDLLLKWCTLRFFDTNPSVLLKCLEFIKQLQQLQLSQDIELHDYEVSSFVPYLLLKAGEPKEMVRAEVRDILDRLCSLYPSSKLFPMVMEGLKTKNSRQKAECLMRMASMVELYGPSVCGNPQAFKVIAQSIGDRDKDVRNGALTCLVAAYMHVGDRVYKFVGNINEKDAAMMEERIKRSNKNRPLIKKPSPPEEKKVVPGRGRTPIRKGAGSGSPVKTEVNGVNHDSDEPMETESDSERDIVESLASHI